MASVAQVAHVALYVIDEVVDGLKLQLSHQYELSQVFY